MRPSKQRESAHWLWQEYLSGGDVSYLESAVLADRFYLHPIEVNGSLISLAIEHRDVSALKLLLELGADANASASGGYTYLHTALELANNPAEIVETLLEAGADPRIDGIFGRNSLHHAAVMGVAVVIPALISHGADVNARTNGDNQTTALMEAARSGHGQIVRLLLDRGADPSLRDRLGMGGGGGRTARDFAIECHHLDVVDMIDQWAKSHNEG